MRKHTSGPWVWSLNKKTHHITLTGKSGWGNTVMDFVRYGMNSAAPRFNVDDLMYRADALASVIPGEEHHAEWNMDINHPDARLMASAPELLEALKTLEPFAWEVCSGIEDGVRTVLSDSRGDLWRKITTAIAKAEGNK